MAKGQKAAKKRRTNVTIEDDDISIGDEPVAESVVELEEETDDAEEPDLEADDVEPTDEELKNEDNVDEEQEDNDVAQAAKTASKRVKDADVDEVESEDEVDEEVDENEGGPVFAPYIAHSEQEWKVTDLFEEAEDGDTIIIYDMDNERWFKLMPIVVGELSV